MNTIFNYDPTKAKPEDSFSPGSPDCWVLFEDYLKPKNAARQTSLILSHQKKPKTELRLKLLEHPVLVGSHKSKRARLMESAIKNTRKCQLKIKRILHFLHARNDKYVCKRKSNFEVYSEIASIHGFTNFVGATTLQRSFWFFMVLLAVIMSCSILLVSYLSPDKAPTKIYPATEYPALGVPYPTITICNFNRISKIKAERLARSFQKSTNLTIKELTNYFKLALFSMENIPANASEFKSLNKLLTLNNLTMQQLLDKIAPGCETVLIKCSLSGVVMRCGYLFRQIETPFGQCCSFNYHAVKPQQNKNVTVKSFERRFYTSNTGSVLGISVLLNPRLDDYVASAFSIAGFHVLLYDVYDFADEGATAHHILTTTTFNNIRFTLKQTFPTQAIRLMKTEVRRCYWRNQRKLFHFDEYSQISCLAECRARMFFAKCNCALPYRPKMQNWTMCGLMDAQCYFKYKYLLSNSPRHDEQLICDCYPLCQMTMYHSVKEGGQLSRKYSLTEKLFNEGVDFTDHILLRVFPDKRNMECLYIDVSENWLSFLGTFGGITGLYMGYSFLSGFEFIFFVAVRPVCNWWNRKRIRERNKRPTVVVVGEGSGNN